METRGQENRPRHKTVNLEKRKHPRFSVDLPVEYYKLGSLVIFKPYYEAYQCKRSTEPAHTEFQKVRDELP